MGAKAKKIYLKMMDSKCTGCRSCQVACSFNLYQVCDPSTARIKVTRSHETGEVAVDLSSPCTGCDPEDKPPCVTACRFGALKLLK